MTDFKDWLDPAHRVQTVVLDRIKVVSQVDVSSYLWQNAVISRHDAAVFDSLDSLILRLEAHVLQEKLPPQTISRDVSVQTEPVPATWWDHFKSAKLEQNKWYWRWLQKLTGPSYTTHTKTATITVDVASAVNYPKATALPAQFGRPYKFVTIDTDVTVW